MNASRQSPLAEMPPFVLECDNGRVDALGLFYAHALGLPLKAVIASYGNTCLDQTADNVARTLAMIQREDIPLLMGADRPPRDHWGYQNVVLYRQNLYGKGFDLKTSWSCRYKRDTPSELAQKITTLAEQSGGSIDYICVGPATNCAAVVKELGAQARKIISRVTILGGKFPPLWEQTPVADMSLMADPDSVQFLMRCDVPIRFVTLNSAWSAVLSVDDIMMLCPMDKMAKVAQKIMLDHCKLYTTLPFFRLHDPAALYACMDEKGFKKEKLSLLHGQDGTNFGRLVPDPEGCDCLVYHATPAHQNEVRESVLRALSF